MTSPSPAEAERRARTIRFFEELSRDTLDRVDDFYAEDCRFEDPMVSLRGRERMRAYYASIYRNDPQLRWEFPECIVDGHSLALAWTMHMRVDGLNGGNPIAVPGISRLRFDADERCLHHRDYFDMGAFVYENVPVLGRVIGLVKKKIHGPEFGADR